MKEDRYFTKDKTGNLIITIKMKDAETQIPIDGKATTIGTYEQEVTQVIEKKNVQTFVDFLNTEIDKAEEQIKELDSGIEKMGSVNTEMFPESLRIDIEKYMHKDSNKALKKELKALDAYLGLITRKLASIRRKDEISKQLDEMKDQMSKIKLAL